GEATVPRPPGRLDDAVHDVDPFDVEQITGVVLGNLGHAELGEQVDAGIQGDVAHAGPYGDQPRLGKFQFLGQGARSLWARVRDRIALLSSYPAKSAASPVAAFPNSWSKRTTSSSSTASNSS